MDNKLVEFFSEKLNIERITAQCLVNCGFTTIEECEDFLSPNLDLLSDLNDYKGYKGVKERIQQAIDNKETVVIYGDYDCDGLCATAMLYSFLISKGVNANYYIPDRHSEGYGMNENALEEIAEEYFPDLLITVDCGITSVDEVLYIQEALGFDVVITDHHSPKEILPDCPIFNPHLSDKGFANLCGAGVVLRLIEGLGGKEESFKYYDLAAVATIADIVPLVEDNRKIVIRGLNLINSKPRAAFKELKNSLKLSKISSTDVAFRIAPRINAVGRMENATKVLDLFKYDEDPFVISSLIEDINEINTKRQNQTKLIYDSVDESLKKYNFEKYPIIVVKGEKWDEGVLGIVAAKIVNTYNRPAIVFTQNGDVLKGSGRSIPEVNIFECVNSANEILDKFGGHPQACGITIKKDLFEDFKLRINEYYKEAYIGKIIEQQETNLYNFREIKNLNKLMLELNKLQPFGEGNEKPVFYDKIQNINFKQLKMNSPHILYKKGNFQMVGFNYADKLSFINSDIVKSIFFTLEEAEYGNTSYIQALISDIKSEDYDHINAENYLNTSLYEDKSIFYPKNISFEEAINISKECLYGCAYICFSKDTYLKAIENMPQVKHLSYFLDSRCPDNIIVYSLNSLENLSNYKKLIFLDRPISLGYIDMLLLDKDCEVYYVENYAPANELKDYLLDYSSLGKIYIQAVETIRKNPYIELYLLYIDIEKRLNVNYNNFVIAMFVFLDLGLIKYEDNKFKIIPNVKNPISNSKLYKLIKGDE